MEVSADAGKPAKPSMLVNVPKLITAYFEEIPDPYGAGTTGSVWNLRTSWFIL